jgi:hypothetical protein
VVPVVHRAAPEVMRAAAVMRAQVERAVLQHSS